jgi:hypothetical protein
MKPLRYYKHLNYLNIKIDHTSEIDLPPLRQIIGGRVGAAVVVVVGTAPGHGSVLI